MNIHKFASVDDFMNVIKQAFCFLWEQCKKGVKFGQGIIYTSISKYQQKGEARTYVVMYNVGYINTIRIVMA